MSAAQGPGATILTWRLSETTDSLDQSRAQFALWAIMAAPLLMGNDLRNLVQVVGPKTRKSLILIRML